MQKGRGGLLSFCHQPVLFVEGLEITEREEEGGEEEEGELQPPEDERMEPLFPPEMGEESSLETDRLLREEDQNPSRETSYLDDFELGTRLSNLAQKKKSKRVRWIDSELGGTSVVTAVFDVASREEYDRSPALMRRRRRVRLRCRQKIFIIFSVVTLCGLLALVIVLLLHHAGRIR